MTSSIIEDFSFIKKKMEEIKNEESALETKPAEPTTNTVNPNPPGVWSTGMKGSGVSQQPPPYEPPPAEHYDPYGNPLYVTDPGPEHDWLVHSPDHGWYTIPKHLEETTVFPYPELNVIHFNKPSQACEELMQWFRDALNTITAVDIETLLSESEARFYAKMENDNQRAAYGNPQSSEGNEVPGVDGASGVLGAQAGLPKLSG